MTTGTLAPTATADQAMERPPGAATLLHRYSAVRAFSTALCEPLETEDYVIQSMPDVSPTRWHLAHTTWFFETFVLKRNVPDYRPAHPQFEYLFNSYYNAVGAQFPRPQRGLLSRPTVREVYAYRQQVDEQVCELLSRSGDLPDSAAAIIELGLHHEQQHQELMLTDIKHVFSCNPLRPVYRARAEQRGQAPPLDWVVFEEGLRSIGHDGSGYSYDNERPRHQVFVPSFCVSTRLVTNGEFLEFLHDGGYQRSSLWLSDGWATVQAEGWKAPLYWENRDGEWWLFTLAGPQRVNPAEPVCHVSFFEAHAYTRWAGVRLPTEAEWETAAGLLPIEGNLAETGRFHPAPCGWRPDPAVSIGAGAAELPAHSAAGDAEARRAGADDSAAQRPATDTIQQMFGDVWEWTASPYVGYPGYKPADGALGEYNGKFMCNQLILRGGSCATSRTHIRPTYRNFFPPPARWQFSGFRIAR